ncbi:MAG TPA: transglutaminase family protein, partial [Methylovirgula sp.]|nr:transglutaminase family protein [Methylovirgula sp.]
MLIQYGYELTINCAQETPLVTLLDERPECVPALRQDTGVLTRPQIPLRSYIDSYGNRVRRFVAPSGDFTLTRSAIIEVPDTPDVVALDACEVPVEHLPDDCLIFLLASRYCETDKLADLAWSLFGGTPPGWRRVQAICDFVNAH